MRAAHTRRPRRGERVLAVVGLVALAAAYLTPLVNPEWNGWRHDHGHATLGAAVAPHSHPWDSVDSGSPPHDHAHEDAPPEGSTPGIVFTASGDSIPGVPAIWAQATLLAIVALFVLGIRPRPRVQLASYAFVPPAPPPRQFLSPT